MAFGFPASYETEIEVAGSRAAVGDAIIATLELLGWTSSIDYTSKFMIARVPTSLASWGEWFEVSLSEGLTLRLRSTCRSWQLFDWGKNKANVEQFREVFFTQLGRASASAGPPPVYLDDAGRTPIERVIEDSWANRPQKPKKVAEE